MKNLLKSIVVVSVVVLSGCGSLNNKAAKESLSERASFELNCPSEQLDFKVFQKKIDGFVTSYGVSGCNKRAVYVDVDQQWLLNSDLDSE